MGDCYLPSTEGEGERLDVLRDLLSRSRIPDMTETRSPQETTKYLLIEYFRNKTPALLLIQLLAVKCCNTCTFLTPVLQGIKRIIQGE